jgi:hypothetical protein
MFIFDLFKKIFGFSSVVVEKGNPTTPRNLPVEEQFVKDELIDTVTETLETKSKKVWVSKGKSTKLIPESELQSYLSKGFIKGRGKKKKK